MNGGWKGVPTPVAAALHVKGPRWRGVAGNVVGDVPVRGAVVEVKHSEHGVVLVNPVVGHGAGVRRVVSAVHLFPTNGRRVGHNPRKYTRFGYSAHYSDVTLEPKLAFSQSCSC